MEQAKVLIKELKGLMGKSDVKSEERRSEIFAWFKEHDDEESQALFDKFMDEGICEIEAEVADIRKQIEDEDYRLLPLSYIARKYFNKSHAWLSQRINGIPVRGHVYTLNAEQKQTFNRAMDDLSKFYGSFRLA